ncbi:helix-turn-helix domain-containing protein [Vagococcus fluvialis]|uniref:helix-turn-helix domain-containing protein n=1 Tax=Vagococcus fluvialis TaxID=2738 RepID=UPI0037DDBD81
MEKLNIGSTLKKLRKGKGFKTKYLIEDIMSESHYYKVENGETNITAILLIKLLD